jgi:hypothetical protein
METMNFIGNLRVEIRTVGIPTALRRAGKMLAAAAEKGERKKRDGDSGNKYQEAKSHDVSQSDSKTSWIRFWPATRSHSFRAMQPWRRGGDQSSNCVRA